MQNRNNCDVRFLTKWVPNHWRNNMLHHLLAILCAVEGDF
jgi:hypothetical protein